MKPHIFSLLRVSGLALILSCGWLFIPLAVIANGGTVVHTTQTDFSQSCAVVTATIPVPVLTDVQITNSSGGEVLLAPSFLDDFDNPTLDISRWQPGNWSGSNTPLVSSSILTVPTATFVRSVNTFTEGILEVVAEFGPGNFQHIGFVEDDLFSKYFMFSTYHTTDTLYARVFYGGSSFEAIPLGSIPAGLHTYRIEWNTPSAGVRFYVDGILVHTSNIMTPTTALYLYLSNDDSPADDISASLQIDKVQIEPPYTTSGVYTSCALDAGESNGWQTIGWSETATDSTSLGVQTRVSADGASWSAWGSAANGGAVVGSLARYVQYRLNFTTSNALVTTAVNSVTLDFEALPAGVIITESGVTQVTEGGATDTYQVKLNSQPASTVTIALTVDTQITAEPMSLDFSPLTWNIPQTVTITAADDAAPESSPHSSLITHTVTSADPDYHNISVAGVSVNIIDNDVANYQVLLPIILQ